MQKYNSVIQWAQLEEITNKVIEEISLRVKVYHHPDQIPVFDLIKDESCKKGFVIIGDLENYDSEHDSLFETKYIKMKKKYEKAQEEIERLEFVIEEIKQALSILKSSHDQKPWKKYDF